MKIQLRSLAVLLLCMGCASIGTARTRVLSSGTQGSLFRARVFQSGGQDSTGEADLPAMLPSAKPQSPPSQANTEIVPLEAGKGVERELKGGQTHTYSVKVEAGQYLHAVAEQKGIDVIIVLFGPDGTKLDEVDDTNGTQGPAPLFFVAQTIGVYRLEVRSLEANASGRYEIKVLELRVASETDRLLADARTLEGKSILLSAAGNTADAIPIAERAVALYQRALGPEHAEVAKGLSGLAELYQSQGEYSKAEPLYRRSLEIQEKLAPESLELTTILNGLAETYRYQGAYSRAEPLYQRALALRQKALGPEHEEVATILNNLGLLYHAQGAYAKAEPLLRRVLEISEKTHQPNDPDVALSLNNLAGFYLTQGAYAKARPLLERAVQIWETSRSRSRLMAVGLNNLAHLYQVEGDYGKAEPLYQRALEILEETQGPEHPDVALCLNNIAELHRLRGAYANAEPLHLRALQIREKHLSPDHPDVANSLNNLALLYRYQGAYAKAEPLYRRALQIREKTLGPEHPDLAVSLNNLADIFQAQRDYSKAEPLYRRALAIREKQLGPDHPDVAGSLNILASLLDRQRFYDKAEPLYRRALETWERALGPDHPNVAEGLHDLARFYLGQGAYGKAEPLYRRALEVREKALGPDHPDVVISLDDMAVWHFATGDLDGALRFRVRAGDAREAEIRRNLTSGSQLDKRLYLQQTQFETDDALSIQAACGPTSTPALRMALTQVLRRKGRVMDVLVDQLAALARSGSPRDRLLLDQLARARANYAALTLRGPGNEGIEPHRKELAAAETRVNELEAKASAQSSRIRSELTPITLDAVAASLPKGATLVEFATYRPCDPKALTYGATRYVVYTLAVDGTIRWADLGEAAKIDAAVVALRGVIRTRRKGRLSDIEREIKPRARALDALVFAPVRKLVGRSTRLLIAPDGQLSLVPFDALVDGRGRYAVERYEISYLTSGRDLLRLRERGASRQRATVFADPDFGGERNVINQPKRILLELGGGADQSMAGLLARAYFTHLPGTAREAEMLGKILSGSRVFTGAQATKRAFGQVSGPQLLHAATHGFFLDNKPLPPPASRGVKVTIGNGLEPPASPVQEDPMLRSGLAFAGANLHHEGEGIVTALEVAGMDLWGTKLVVLSACDTGVGEVRNGDGVYGLRRALVLAGSETQVISIWPVSDTGTQDLMIRYYRRLLSGDGRAAALRAVRLRMLRESRRRHPYFWAPFIVSGEWANLEGKRMRAR